LLGIKERLVHYVALGDSLAEGVTPYGEMDKGYPSYFSDMLRNSETTIQFNNFGVHGYTTEDLKRELLENETIRNTIKEATIITLNIGANDFFHALKRDQNSAEDTLKQFTGNFSIILDEIKNINKIAGVYVLGYYNPFENAPENMKLTRLLTIVNEIIKNKTEVNNYTFVEIQSIVSESYDECLPNPEDFHLSSKGYELLANRIFEYLE
jgi:lysophospholipase L1-like esterase